MRFYVSNNWIILFGLFLCLFFLPGIFFCLQPKRSSQHRLHLFCFLESRFLLLATKDIFFLPWEMFSLDCVNGLPSKKVCQALVNQSRPSLLTPPPTTPTNWASGTLFCSAPSSWSKTLYTVILTYNPASVSRSEKALFLLSSGGVPNHLLHVAVDMILRKLHWHAQVRSKALGIKVAIRCPLLSRNMRNMVMVLEHRAIFRYMTLSCSRNS